MVASGLGDLPAFCLNFNIVNHIYIYIYYIMYNMITYDYIQLENMYNTK